MTTSFYALRERIRAGEFDLVNTPTWQELLTSKADELPGATAMVISMAAEDELRRNHHLAAAKDRETFVRFDKALREALQEDDDFAYSSITTYSDHSDALDWLLTETVRGGVSERADRTEKAWTNIKAIFYAGLREGRL